MHVWRIRRWILVPLLIVGLLLLAAGLRDTSWWRNVAYGRPLEFAVLGVAELPQPLVEAYGTHHWHEGADAYQEDECLLYVLIRWGQMPTGGHRIEPVAVSLARRPSGWQIRVMAQYLSPAPGQPVIEVITFPAAGVKVQLPADMPENYVAVVVDQAGRTRATTEPLR